VPSLDFPVEETWGPRQAKRRLCDVVPGFGFDSASKLFPFFFGTLRADQHSIPTRLTDRLDNQFVEVLEDVVSL